MRTIVIILIAVFIGLAGNTAQASIVNDPVALAAKLKELRAESLARQLDREAYWAEYRALPDIQVQRKVCSKVYTNKGVYRKCRMETFTEKDTRNFNKVQPSLGVTGDYFNE